MAKPSIKDGTIEPWARGMRELARRPLVCCKLSGMVTEIGRPHWTVADLRPYVEVVLEAFGPERVLFGSDWPVCWLPAATHAGWRSCRNSSRPCRRESALPFSVATPAVCTG